MQNDESRLVGSAKAGSTDAIGELFDRHWVHVWRAALSITGRRDMADDVAQDAFVRAIQRLETFDEGRAFRPWVTRIAVNRAIDLMRRERWVIPIQEAEGPEAGPAGDEDLERALLVLGPDRRTVILLKYWLGYPVRDIAEILRIPIGTVASRLNRGLSELRSLLEANHE
jgi:RNA polymerase sigma-70 factor (ECF subfamily)